MISRTIGFLITTLVALLLGWQFVQWTVNYVYVPPGKSLQLRYKGALVFTWGQKYPDRPGAFAKEGEVGVLEQLRGPGRHFYCPLWWERRIVDDLVVKSGEIAILRSTMGEDLGKGQFLVDGDVGQTHNQGILRKAFGPGRYRLNDYAYKASIVRTERVETTNGQWKHSGWVPINPGYVGVVTYLADNPALNKRAGIQDEVLPPGLYPVNPHEMQIDIVSIGFNARDISTDKQTTHDGKPLVDESGEEMPLSDTGISFPSSDGFKIHMDFSTVWGVMPEQAPEMIRRFGTVEAVEQKIIIPQCESICRNFGSRVGAVDLLVGDSRQKFQEEVDSAFSKVLKDKNLTLLFGLIRHIYIPKEVREPIQKGYVADELKLTREQETTTAKAEANLREAEQKVFLEAAKINEETKKLVANIKAKGQQIAEQTAAETEKKVAIIDRQAAELDAQRVVFAGEAQANAQQMQQEARAELFALAVKAFGDPDAFTKWQFAEGLPSDIGLNMIYAGPGTLWTDLKNLTPVVNVKPPAKAPSR
jgi:regulator of protease activity HflC (stomatin/prohibitin superfamily)